MNSKKNFMELIDLIYKGLQVSIALLGLVIIFSYLISRLSLNKKKIIKSNQSNLNMINSPSILPELVVKNNFYQSEALKHKSNSQLSITNMNLRYLKSSDEIFKGTEKHLNNVKYNKSQMNNVKYNKSQTRYTIINEEMRKKQRIL